MSFNQDLINALRERQADNLMPDNATPQTAVWNGETLNCCAGEAKSLKDLGIAGFAPESDMILVFVTDDFVPGFQQPADLNGKIPVSKQTLVYSGKQYRIEDVIIPPGLAFIVTGLIDPNKGV